MDINGIDALLHERFIVWKSQEAVRVGDYRSKRKVKITKIDEKTKRVSASIKALTEDPYQNISKKYKLGEIYDGVCTKLMDYGVFVKLEEGIEGLIHNSELSWANKNIQPSKVLSVSQKIKVKIVNIDIETKNIFVM